MKILLLSLLIALTAGHAMARDYSSCFVPGEVSEYRVTWMMIPLSWSKTTTEAITEDDRELIRIRMETQTYATYTHIYKVDDITEVIVDPVTALPLRLDLIMNEGSREKSHLTTFDHANKTATFIDRIAGTTNSVAIESNTREVMTFLYAMREESMLNLTNEIHSIFVDGKMHEMGVGHVENEHIKLPDYGKVECDKIEPIAEFDALFLREGKIFFWISKINRRMITCVKAKVAVGNITVKLQSVTGPGDDFWIKERE
ncbi:DUF3108 domain-containing protein [Pontiellaceae bacterium B1224]|nr:DUF3108 domain-containing protein [Pontiellaceae bacterium B1224]